ncbi:Protoporphyrinogen oxidase [Decorospora gaudefroyi]|uniref:Protoporphyrinogen oxidase n=1 Tax=Decorospora gaudefroyi TaxID=184978 RepID=A0A6A5KEC6_9PLEO|nr:Protoporphyrinogen oxidase [Decorospora gaudefroyi]
MRLKSHHVAPLLASSVKSRPLRALPWLLQHRNASTSTAPSTSTASPERIAVLGGGIAGLSSAYFLSKEFPNAKIVLFEAGKRTGGWLSSKRVQVGQGGETVLFESGPRTLRNATATAGLIQELGLVDQVIYTKRSEPGAQNRFLYYPDQLNRLPTGRPSLADLLSLWRTGMLAGVFGIITEPLQTQRPKSLTDETIGSFLTRRIDQRIADNIVSAGIHGIYAGDIWQLSAKTLLGLAWQLEGRYGSALGGYVWMQGESPRPEDVTLVHPFDLEVSKAMNEEIDIDADFMRNLGEASMFSFRNGLQSFVYALQEATEANGNVQIRTETPIQSLAAAEGKQGIDIIHGPEASSSTETFDLAISTLRDDVVTPYVTVMTVNLYYTNPNLLPVQGFGYLIPRSIPFEQNPERALGVIFDSSAIKGQDTASGTKLTVMLGGHWWDGWDEYPSEAEAIEMAQSVVRRHLRITEEAKVSFANLAKDCIPQYTVGYSDRLRTFAENLVREFDGRLRVVGAQFNGVGVNDCIAGAWHVARGCRGNGWKGKSCGLERAMDTREWVVAGRSEMRYMNRMAGLGTQTGADSRGDGGV